MSDEERTALAAELASAEEVVTRLRAENSERTAAFRLDPPPDEGDGREILKRAAASLAAARDRVDAAKSALAVFDKTGSRHGLVAHEGRVFGTIAVRIPPGMTQEARATAVEEVLSPELDRAVEELGVVLAAKPLNYTRERPGRDASGRTVLEVAGRVEGDRLVPAVSRASKTMRT